MPGPRPASSASTSAASAIDVDLEALIWAISSARSNSPGNWGANGCGSSDSAGPRGTSGATAAAGGAGSLAQPSWTPDSLLAALDLALPDTERGQRAWVAVQQGDSGGAVWSDNGAADGRHSDYGLESVLLPAVVAPASNLHPPSSSLAWSSAVAPAELGSWLDGGAARADRNKARPSPDRLLPQLVSFLSRDSATNWQGAEPGLGGREAERLMGPLAAEGPALAGLMCAAAGVAWTSQQPLQPAGGWAHGPPAAAPANTAAMSSCSALDPALDWALGVLSDRVSHAEPSPGDVRLANRTFAAHVRRAGGMDVAHPESQSRRHASGVSAVEQAPSSCAGALPWQALQPLVAALGNRLSPCSALALLQVLVRQVGRSWRQQQPGDASSPLPARQQQQVAATCQALFAAALRQPEQLPRATAAGLLVVMRRLQLHSPPTCALLVERLLASSSAAEATGATAAAPGSTDMLDANGEGGKRLRLALRRGRGRGRAVKPLRLEWVAMALSCLGQLRVPAEALPRRAVTRLFRSAVAPANRRRWTPPLAAALLVWAARLHCRPPAAALKLYMKGLLEARTGASWRRRRGGNSSKRPTDGMGIASTSPPARPCSLLARMRGPQLMAVLEALWRLYGPEASPQAAAAAGRKEATSPVSGPPHHFQRLIAAALMGRLQQLPRQQLLRLPLLMARLGLTSLRRPEHLQAFSVQVQKAAGSCDALDVVLLLRGLAAEARGEAQPPRGGAAASEYCGWQRGELADVALRRYTVLLPSASPRFSAAALEALPALWLPPHSGLAAAASSSARAAADSAEADLQRRRAADMAAERQWLLQQLDDHLAEALAEAAVRLEHAVAASRRGVRAGGDRGSQRMEHDAGVSKLVLQVLESHVALRRQPSQRLQAALEAAVVAVAPTLGTSGCTRVRAAYWGLGLSAGSRLNVALVTFG
ncbi:hypothetical protein HXX76_009428 [Chlamydomonas incerta]|uniref:Uncharacterized protein n=1 Tax=Chlamydomonas incerta TaxID=51695 RepID=A0A835VZA5_CHLIN|nr:hypothetical protein HXX76_009428 [Chlamydomonas incerta]|eukprot:KAG2431413.1 hypothetical protein HXX76_009428 [Chlamydomonas incerta]